MTYIIQPIHFQVNEVLYKTAATIRNQIFYVKVTVNSTSDLRNNHYLRIIYLFLIRENEILLRTCGK